MSLVLHHSTATGTEKLVLIGIANHDGDGGAFPSIATLAAYANVSERSVQRAIERLVEMGEVSVHLQDGGQRDGRYRTNRYEVHVSCPEGCDRSKNHRVRPVENVASRGDAHDTPDSSGVTPMTPRGDAGVVSGVTLASPEPVLEPVHEPTDDDTREHARGAARHAGRSSEFEIVLNCLARAALSKRKAAGYDIEDDDLWLVGTRRKMRRERGGEIRDRLARGLDAASAVMDLVDDPSLARWTLRREGLTHLAEVQSA